MEDQIERLKLQLAIWEKAVDTQMHFNEMSVKSRQLGLTFVVAALGLSIVLMGRGSDFDLVFPIPFTNVQVSTHVTGPIILVAVFGLYAVMRLDLGVYHRMLRGAVTFGEQFEKGVLRDELMKTPKGMTEFISLFSRQEVVNKETFEEAQGKNAEQKIRTFYVLLIGTLLLIGLIVTFSFGKIERPVVDPVPGGSNAAVTSEMQNEGPGDTVKTKDIK